MPASVRFQPRRFSRLLVAGAFAAVALLAQSPAMAQPMGGARPGPAMMDGQGGMGKAGAMGPMGMMGMMGGGMPHERALDAINATPEQRTQMRQIADAARADLRSLHDQARPLHDQARALFTQPTVDANAAEALRQQMMAVHEQASKRRLQAMLDASRVLSPEQRTKLAEMRQRHRGMMEHRRGPGR